MRLKIALFFCFFTVSIFYAQNDGFYDTIILEDIERLYPMNETEEPSYTMSLHFDFNRYRVGSPIEMEIRIYARKGTISFTNASNPFENYRFVAYDQNNKPVLEADNYTLWNYRSEAGVPIESGGNRVITLREGETFSYTIDLNNWFSIEKIGRYRIEGTFNPMPDISRNFSMKSQTSFFFVDEALEKSQPRVGSLESISQTSISPSQKPPYEVIDDALIAMRNRKWDGYFLNMHMPSIISISDRYSDRYRENYEGFIEDFSDIGLEQKANNSSLDIFLRRQFGDTLSIPTMRSNFGDNFVTNLEQTFRANTVRMLSLRFELLYRTALPEERKRIFDEFRKYLTSAYDRNVRVSFVTELEQRVASERNEKDRRYYSELLSMIRAEYNPAVTYTLLRHEITKTTIEEKYGLPTAVVEATLYQRFFNFDTGDIYEPRIQRIFTLRKMGDYWYIVNYYDRVVR